ncbi:MAG: uroporphyrinogen decarboxylase family protein [Patescibacteria group bacterium]
MTSRARVIAALEHRQPDRVPVDLWSKGGGLTNGAYRRLRQHLGIEGEAEAYRPGQTAAFYDERILERLQIDFRHVFLRPPAGWTPQRKGENETVNEWGVTLRRAGDTACPVDPPLAGADLDDLDKYPWPRADLPGRTDGLKERVERLFAQGEHAIAYRPVTPIDYGIFETAWTLRGMEDLLCDMVVDKRFAHKLMRKVLETQIAFYDLGLGIAGPYVQVVQIGDDYGTQNAPILSPALFREMIKPYDAELIAFIKSKAPRAKVFLHTCGAVRDLIEDLIEAGVDILNPLQPAAAGMDSAGLKRDFGARLSFQGAISVQGALQGTAAEVRAEVERRVDALGGGGGYILAPANNISEDVPPENVVLMYEHARAYSSRC